jgi:signal transduction histidine kinase
LSLAVVVLCLVIASSPMALDHLSVHAPKNSWGIAAVSALVGMAASATWFTSWAISGRRQPAYVGVALAPAWLMAEFGNAYGSLAHHRPTGLVGVVPPLAALLLLRQARIGAEVDTAMRPWRLVVALLAGFALLLVGDIPLSRLAGTASFYTGLVVGAGLASAALWCVAGSRGHLIGTDLRVCVLALALGSVDRSIGAAGAGNAAAWAMTAARVVSLLGWCCFLALAIRSIAAARAAGRERQRSLRTDRDALSRGMYEQQSSVAQMHHDLRSLVAGIHSATTTLTRYRDHLDPVERANLEAALGAELCRLRNSVGTVAPPAHFSLREAIEPVVIAERARGTAVTAHLSDVEVMGSADATAALIQNLITNARRHAPGAATSISTVVVAGVVELTVSDDGPGLSAAGRARVRSLFAGDAVADVAAGARRGLGLTICARLAAEQGARLHLAETTSGTQIELTLRVAVKEPVGMA